MFAAFRTPITGATVIVASRNGRYDVTLYKVLEDRNLPHSETSFECTLSLPGTAYQTSQKITYSPGKWQATRHTFGTRRFLVWWQRCFLSRPLRGAAILPCTPIDINQPHRKRLRHSHELVKLEPLSQRPAPTRAVECVRPCENMLADDGPLVNEGPGPNDGQSAASNGSL